MTSAPLEVVHTPMRVTDTLDKTGCVRAESLDIDTEAVVVVAAGSAVAVVAAVRAAEQIHNETDK